MTSIEERGTALGICRVTLSRTDSADVQQRQIYARIDDGPTQTLIFGNSVTLEVPAGDHVLRANNTLFWKRVAFSVAPGQHVEFALINRAGLFGLGFLALLGAAPLSLSIERR
jgi:hypothetical protein